MLNHQMHYHLLNSIICMSITTDIACWRNSGTGSHYTVYELALIIQCINNNQIVHWRSWNAYSLCFDFSLIMHKGFFFFMVVLKPKMGGKVGNHLAVTGTNYDFSKLVTVQHLIILINFKWVFALRSYYTGNGMH